LADETVWTGSWMMLAFAALPTVMLPSSPKATTLAVTDSP